MRVMVIEGSHTGQAPAAMRQEASLLAYCRGAVIMMRLPSKGISSSSAHTPTRHSSTDLSCIGHIVQTHLGGLLCNFWSDMTIHSACLTEDLIHACTECSHIEIDLTIQD